MRQRTTSLIGTLIAALTLSIAVYNAVATPVAIPSMVEGMAASLSQVQFGINLHFMMTAACVLLAGRYVDSRGDVKVFKLASLLTALLSFAYLFVFDVRVFMAFRFIEGICAAFLMASGSSILITTSNVKSRPKLVGISSGFGAFFVACGPLFAGLAVDFANWNMIYACQGVLCVTSFIAALFLPDKESGHQPFAFDGILALELFSIPSFVHGVLTLVVVQAIMCYPIVLSIVGQSLFKLTASDFGAMVCYASIPGILAAPLSGYLTRLISYRGTLSLGFIMLAIGVITVDNSIHFGINQSLFFLGLVFFSLGVNIAMTPLFTMSYFHVPQELIGRAIGTYNTLKYIGAALGIMLLGLFSSISDKKHLSKKAEYPLAKLMTKKSHTVNKMIFSLSSIGLLLTLALVKDYREKEFTRKRQG